MQWNARSIQSRTGDLDVVLRTIQPHVIAIQETWLKDNMSTPSFTNYITHRKDRDTGANGGGVLMLIRNNVNYIHKDIIAFQGGQIEVQAITIKSNKQNIDILNMYNPIGNMNKLEFLHYKSQLNAKYFIVGDLNGHNPLWEPTKNPQTNNCGKTLQEIITENDDIALITPPDLPTYVHS